MTSQQTVIAVLLLIAVFVVVRVATRKPNPSADSDVNEFMPKLAEEARTLAAEHGVTLDYSPESVERVEALLSDFHQARTNSQLSDRDLHLHALQFGAYIGEVLRRKYGGHWAMDHETVGKQTFPISWKDGQSFPVGWCGKRMLNGEEDNVWHKYQVVTSEEYLRGAVTQSNNDPGDEPDSH